MLAASQPSGLNRPQPARWLAQNRSQHAHTYSVCVLLCVPPNEVQQKPKKLHGSAPGLSGLYRQKAISPVDNAFCRQPTTRARMGAAHTPKVFSGLGLACQRGASPRSQIRPFISAKASGRAFAERRTAQLAPMAAAPSGKPTPLVKAKPAVLRSLDKGCYAAYLATVIPQPP